MADTMATQIPHTMRALALSRYCKPADYDVATLPTPEISQPDELLIKVHAASVNPIDVKLASGLGKMLEKSTFPYKIGYDLAGTVVKIGPSVTLFKPGDEVYSRVASQHKGSIAQYALSTESKTALKPPSLSFAEAASIPLAAQTALQALDRAERSIPGGLKGKTVFIPAGLSGTGSFAVQLAKNVFGAGKVVTTLSTTKVAIAEEFLGKGTPDLIVDYTKENVVEKIGKGSVDFMLDTAGQTLSALKVVKKGGVIVSISTVPSGDQMMKQMPDLKFYLRFALNFVDWVLRSWTKWNDVDYGYMSLEGNREDLERLTGWVEEGSLRPVVGEMAGLSDIEGVRRGCGRILDGKGGVGKFVIEID